MFNWDTPISILLILSYGITGTICANASISDYPYHVSIEYNNSHSCSGALIVERWILTVASCVRRQGLTNLTVRVSSAIASTGGKELQVRSVFIHEDFDSITHENDIALLELRVPLEYGEGRLPVILPSSESEIDAGTTVALTGWLMTSRLDNSSQLTVVSSHIINENVCRSSLPAFKELTESMLCSGYISGDRKFCQGDIGAPLVHEERVIGLLSYGLGCIDERYPVVYTKTSSFITWIFNIAGIIF